MDSEEINYIKEILTKLKGFAQATICKRIKHDRTKEKREGIKKIMDSEEINCIKEVQEKLKGFTQATI